MFAMKTERKQCRISCRFTPGLNHIDQDAWDSVIEFDGYSSSIKQYVNPATNGRKKKHGADLRIDKLWEGQQKRLRIALNSFDTIASAYFSDKRFIVEGAEILEIASESPEFGIRLSLFTLDHMSMQGDFDLDRCYLDHVKALWKAINRILPHKINPSRTRRRHS